MIWLALLLAQAPNERGVAVFRESCAVGYCHGLDGAQGGAPRLAGRGFDAAYIERVVRGGVAGTTMPAFKDTLSEADLRAVIAYASRIAGSMSPRARRGAAPPAAEAPPPRGNPPNEAKPGRALFFDSVRGVLRCGTCHQVDGWGLNIASIAAPESAAALRAVAGRKVRTAQLAGQPPFPALTAGDGQIYDLTMSPPVLRSVDDVKLSPAANWNHAVYLVAYKDAELEQILVFLKWATASGR